MTVELEKWWHDGSHSHGSDVRKERHRIGVRVARTPGGVGVTIDPGFGSKESALVVTALLDETFENRLG